MLGFSSFFQVQNTWMNKNCFASPENECSFCFFPQYNLVCDNKWLIDLTQSILNLGFLVGGFTLGYAADR